MKSRLAAKSLGVSLTVANLESSVQWYCNVLGFQIKNRYARGDAPFAVSLEAGNVQILLTRDDGSMIVGSKCRHLKVEELRFMRGSGETD